MAEKEYIEREAATEAAIDAADEWDGGYNPHRAAIVPVPPHGRLIDADALIATIRPVCDEDAFAACTFETVKRLMVEHINAAPTVLEAEEGE